MTHRTKENEDKYKNYWNKLTSILRYEKKRYYEQLLQKHKNNIKATWSVLNKIIKNQNNVVSPTCIVKKGNEVIESIESIVNEFNDFFC